MILSGLVEKLTNLVQSCMDAVGFVNGQYVALNEQFNELQNDYNSNVVYNSPQNGIQTQNITIGMTFGLGTTTTANIPIFEFTLGSILRYDRILPYNQTDGLEVVNFQTLVNYVANISSSFAGLQLPEISNVPPDYILAVEDGVAKWVAPSTILWDLIPQPTLLQAGYILSAQGGGLGWVDPTVTGAGSGSTSNIMTYGLIFTVASGSNPTTFVISPAVYRIGFMTGSTPYLDLDATPGDMKLHGSFSGSAGFANSSASIATNVGAFVKLHCNNTGNYQFVGNGVLYEGDPSSGGTLMGNQQYPVLTSGIDYYYGLAEIYYLYGTSAPVTVCGILSYITVYELEISNTLSVAITYLGT